MTSDEKNNNLTSNFNNSAEIYNQAGVQHNHGPLYNGPSYYGPVTITNQATHGENIIDFNKATDQSLDYKDVLRFLAFPEMFERRSNIEKAHPDTCKWILDLDSFKSWQARPYGLLWIKGKPGAGKSTLMGFLYDHFKAERPEGGNKVVYLDFFFSARGTDLQRTPIGMLRSLLNQIFFQVPTVRPAIQNAFQEKCMLFGNLYSDWEWSKGELEVLFGDAVIEAAKSVRIDIFVDAIDEAGEQSAREVATYLHRLNDRVASSQSSMMKICISCRHYPIVSSSQAVEIWVERHNSHDIARFIHDRLNVSTIAMYEHVDAAAVEDITYDLVRLSAGVFQWVHIMVPLVESYILEGESPAIILARLRELPQELDSLYAYILQYIIKPEYRSRAFLLFKWICLSRRPLNLAELRYALAAKDATTEPFMVRCHETRDFIRSDVQLKSKIAAWSGGLAEIIIGRDGELEAHIVQVVHQSVREYMVLHGLQAMHHWKSNNADSSTTDGDARTIVAQCHKTLHQHCFNYIATEKVTSSQLRVSEESGPYHPASVISNRRAGLEEKHPFMQYAVAHGFYHGGKSTSWSASELRGQMLRLSASLEQWYMVSRYLMGKHYRDEQPETLLHQICMANWSDAARLLTHDGVDINARDMDGSTAMHLVANTGNLVIADILVRAGANTEATNRLGKTPLTIAAARGDASMVSWLLAIDPQNPNSRSANISEALATAASAGSKYIVQLLLDSGVDCNLKDKRGMRPLEAAAFCGDFEIVEILLNAGADIRSLDGRYGSALHAATYLWWWEDGDVRQRRILAMDVIECLLEAGTDLDVHDHRVDTPLCVAIRDQRIIAADTLLELGADPNIPSCIGTTALHYSVLTAFNELIDTIVAKMKTLDTPDFFGRTALHYAVTVGNDYAIQVLLDRGASITVLDQYGRTPFDALSSNSDFFSRLWEQAPDQGEQDFDGSIKLSPTSPHLTKASLYRSIANLVSAMVRPNGTIPVLPGLWELGCCLLLVGDVENATFAIQQWDHTSINADGMFQVCCRCRTWRILPYWICSECPDRLFCNNCYQAENRLCASHKCYWIVELPQDEPDIKTLEPALDPKRLRRWLKRLLTTYGAFSGQGLDPSIIGLKRTIPAGQGLLSYWQPQDIWGAPRAARRIDKNGKPLDGKPYVMKGDGSLKSRAEQIPLQQPKRDRSVEWGLERKPDPGSESETDSEHE